MIALLADEVQMRFCDWSGKITSKFVTTLCFRLIDVTVEQYTIYKPPNLMVKCLGPFFRIQMIRLLKSLYCSYEQPVMIIRIKTMN